MGKRLFHFYKTRLLPWAKSKLVLCALLAIAVSACTLNLHLSRVEAYFYDVLMRLKGHDDIDSRIALLIIGEPNNGENQFLHYNSLENHILALEKLIQEKPAAIAYLNKFDMSEVEATPKLAEKFVELASLAQNNGTKIIFGTDVDLGGEVLPPYPISLLPHAPAFLFKDGTIFGEDKVVRRALLTVNDEPSLQLRLAYPELTRDELLSKAGELRGSYFFKPAHVWHLLIRYPENTSSTESRYDQHYFSELLSGKDTGHLTGKIVLIDTIRKDVANDFFFTPYSGITYQNPRLYIQAATLNTLLKDNGITLLRKNFDTALTIILSFVLCYMTMLYSPTRGVLSFVGLALATFFLSLLLFRFGFWMRLVHPMSALFVAYYMIVPYRAILEYKMRWDVQQKHDLLVKVEEIKGNFLSLMSHDLKTPVARIQGLAELILKQGGLQASQQNEMQQIIQSTESLDKFISKILHLTKIESNDIKLVKRSKDINKILEQCVHNLEFQARQKKIRVELKLEPLFPVKIDPSLVIQVFTNIIDNAIKYSNEGGSVEIQSRETGSNVEVVVSDTGNGMDDEELDQLFTKFFRGKSHPGDATKGSGLGLYLSKYFIELHDGSVAVESIKGVGSKFKILLPINAVS